MTNLNDNPTAAPLIDPDALGVEVSWSFGDGDAEAVSLPRGAVAAVFADFGFDFDPNNDPLEMTEEMALRRAARYAPSNKALQVKELARPNKDTPRAFGIYERVTIEGESGDRWTCGARVRIDGAGVVCLPPEGGYFTAISEKIGTDMADLSNRLINEVMNVDISSALVAVGGSMNWIGRRRNAGGVYFIRGGERAERFVGVLRALAAMTSGCSRDHRFFPQIQEVYAKPLTVASWSESARTDIEADLKTLLSALRSMRDTDKMREATKLGHADEADALIAKAEHYRDLLGSIAGDLAGELTLIRDTFRKAAASGVESIRGDLDAILLDTPAATPAPAPSSPAEVVEAAPAPVVPAKSTGLSSGDLGLFDF